MAIRHQNRKGDLYYLHQGVTKTGKPRYWFSRQADGELVEEIPPGFEIAENLDGLVSLRKKRPAIITDAELQIVRAALDRIPRLRRYEVEIRQDSILVYEATNPIEFLREAFGEFMVARVGSEKLAAFERRSTQYHPVMRFTLIDRQKRLFAVDRMYYSGEGGWLPLHDSGDLASRVRKYVRHLGKDSFYELI